MSKKIAVHSGTFHLDEMIAIAIVKMALENEEVEIFRSRDKQVLETCDIWLDVGDVHNPDLWRFDHHMPGGAGQRPNGIPYATAGLVWKHFGLQIAGSQYAADIVEKKMIMMVDANDSGWNYLPLSTSDVGTFTISHMVDCFNILWNEDSGNIDQRFIVALSIVEQVVRRFITSVKAQADAEGIMERACRQQSLESECYVVTNRYIPAEKVIIEKFPDILFYVYLDSEGLYRIKGINVKEGSYDLRKPLPQSWRGKRRQDLVDVTGIPEASFCHPAGFMAGATSIEGAIKLVELALKE